jgi:hypothetical protein
MNAEPLLRAESLEAKYQDIPRRIKWNPLTSPIVFQLEATKNPTITQEIQAALTLQCTSTSDVLKLNDMLSNTYNNICENLDT